MIGRQARALLVARIALAVVIVPRAPGHVLVVTESGVPALADAVDGLTASLGTSARVIDVDSPRGALDLAEALRSRDAQVIVAVGSRALSEVAARKPAQPVIATMILRGAGVEATAQLTLDLPLAVPLGAIHTLLPRASRIGIIRNPLRSRDSIEALENQARHEGFQTLIEDCDSPARLLKTLASLRNRVDVLLCFPDPDLYNPATIPPLVMASLEYRLPIVGFSPAFVHAGAAVGVYADYRAVGRQTAELALRAQHHEFRGEGSEESPSKVRVAVNQRIARLLGLDFHLDAGVEVFR
ncbi:MAG TPA: ABC transporter substrate binding protein [Verrucomicrobiae bacterium]|nr:ABC transporter substrate binding protein [Verrucomicrobiae bacterium]